MPRTGCRRRCSSSAASATTRSCWRREPRSRRRSQGMNPDLAFALELAELADSLTLPRFGAVDLRVDTKADLTPVTDADRTVERALRERIALERPGEAVLGEEEGGGGGGSGGARWILDPVDGTKNFARGIPVWATLVALERAGEVVCGVVSAPAL